MANTYITVANPGSGTVHRTTKKRITQESAQHEYLILPRKPDVACNERYLFKCIEVMDLGVRSLLTELLLSVTPIATDRSSRWDYGAAIISRADFLFAVLMPLQLATPCSTDCVCTCRSLPRGVLIASAPAARYRAGY